MEQERREGKELVVGVEEVSAALGIEHKVSFTPCFPHQSPGPSQSKQLSRNTSAVLQPSRQQLK
jgi:hypothetical protein